MLRAFGGSVIAMDSDTAAKLASRWVRFPRVHARWIACVDPTLDDACCYAMSRACTAGAMVCTQSGAKVALRCTQSGAEVHTEWCQGAHRVVPSCTQSGVVCTQ